MSTERCDQVITWAEETRSMLDGQYSDMGYDTVEEQIGVALTGLRHLCDVEGLDYSAIDAAAKLTYEEEITYRDCDVYGFSVANHAAQEAWFYTPLAATNFAHACGWTKFTVEVRSQDTVSPKDIMDTPEKPWTKD